MVGFLILRDTLNYFLLLKIFLNILYYTRELAKFLKTIMSSFIHEYVQKYLISIYYVAGTVLGTKDSGITKTKILAHMEHIF